MGSIGSIPKNTRGNAATHGKPIRMRKSTPVTNSATRRKFNKFMHVNVAHLIMFLFLLLLPGCQFFDSGGRICYNGLCIDKKTGITNDVILILPKQIK